MIAVHLKHTRSRLAISPNALEKGMVLFLRYKTIGGESRQYVATVLNANFEGKLHILSMNEIKLQDFRNFAEGFGITYIPRFKKATGVNIPKMSLSISSKAIYEGVVKPELAASLNASYRTLILKNISGLQLLEYDFGPELNKQLDS
tara:strand:- start:1238 stop:1678 length:441 start_codon:yes stop_codon:yes gene_type:complete